MSPFAGRDRDSKPFGDFLGIQAEGVRDVRLHEGAEALALKDASAQSTEQCDVEKRAVDGARVVGVQCDILEDDNQLMGGLEEGLPVVDGDVIRLGPGKLGEDADQVLVRALGALLGVGRLQKLARTCAWLQTNTYTVGDFNELRQRHHLLSSDKTLEVIPGPVLIAGGE